MLSTHVPFTLKLIERMGLTLENSLFCLNWDEYLLYSSNSFDIRQYPLDKFHRLSCYMTGAFLAYAV